MPRLHCESRFVANLSQSSDNIDAHMADKPDTNFTVATATHRGRLLLTFILFMMRKQLERAG